MYWHHWWFGGGFGWPGILMAVGMALFWVAVIVLVVWAVRELAGRRPAHTGGLQTGGPTAPAGARTATETPLQILERRYANGEIEREEFLRRKEDLSSTPPAS
jgi:putative membrane protein